MNARFAVKFQTMNDVINIIFIAGCCLIIERGVMNDVTCIN